MSNSLNPFKSSIFNIIKIISLSSLAIGGLYYIYENFFDNSEENELEKEIIKDFINTNLSDIRKEIKQKSLNDSINIPYLKKNENLKKKIFLKINQKHEEIMKSQITDLINKYKLTEFNNILSEDILQNFLEVNWKTYKSTTDFILTRIGLSEKEYVSLINNMSLSDYMEYEYLIEKNQIFQGRKLLKVNEAKKAFLDYFQISEIYVSSLLDKVNENNSNKNFDEDLQMAVLFSNIKIDTQIYLKYKFTPKEILYMMRIYDLINYDEEVKNAYETMCKNSPNFFRV